MKNNRNGLDSFFLSFFLEIAKTTFYENIMNEKQITSQFYI